MQFYCDVRVGKITGIIDRAHHTDTPDDVLTIVHPPMYKVGDKVVLWIVDDLPSGHRQVSVLGIALIGCRLAPAGYL